MTAPTPWKWIAVALFAFVALFFATVPDTTADTVVYVDHIASYQEQGALAKPLLLWEFGHLLWRPLGYGLWQTLLPALRGWSHGNAQLEITAVLIAVNFINGALLLVLLFFFSRRLGLGNAGAMTVAGCFLFSATILNYVHSGMSYNPGLTAQIGGWILILRAVSGERRAQLSAMLGGVLLALSCALWFPYVLTLPAALVAGWFGEPAKASSGALEARVRLRLMLLAAISAAAVGVVLFGAGAAFNHFYTFADWKFWVANSAHGVSTERSLVRLPAGLTRSFLFLGNDGIVMKRYALGDPYAPVSRADLLRAGLWKVAAVGVTFAVLFVAALRYPKTRPALVVLLCGVLPVLWFAIFLFDTAEPARYEPFYPSLIVVICSVFLARQGGPLPRLWLAAFAAIMVLVNLSAFGFTLRKANDAARARAELVSERIGGKGFSFMLSYRDPVSTLIQKAPFSRLNRRGALPFVEVIESGSVHVATWRRGVACRTLQAWAGHQEVWASDRLAAARPKAEWNWAEYDDSRVKWVDLPQFFNEFVKDDHIGRDDGFFRLAATPENRGKMAGFCPNINLP